MKNSHGLAVQGSQLLAKPALVLPDGLQPAFVPRVAAFAQATNAAAAQPTLGIITGRIAGHLPLLLRRWFCYVKPRMRFGAGPPCLRESLASGTCGSDGPRPDGKF